MEATADRASMPSGPLMNDNDIAYAAGLIDGEGSILLVKAHSSENRTPHVTMGSTTIELVEWMRDIFGGKIVNKVSRNPKHKDAYEWKVSYRKALDFLRLVLPYLKEPEKKRKAILLLERYLDVTPRNGKYTSAMKVERRAFEAEFYPSKRNL